MQCKEKKLEGDILGREEANKLVRFQSLEKDIKI